MNDETTGFNYLSIDREGTGYAATSIGSTRMVVLGFTRAASSRERYLVNPDLTLRSFSADLAVDGRPVHVAGETTQRGIRAAVDGKEGRKEQLLKSKGPIYPAPLLNLVPLVKGIAPGRSLVVKVLDLEEMKVKEVKVEVVGSETLPDGTRAIHLRNNLYPLVDNDIWVDPAGNTLRESVRDGLIVTSAEDPIPFGAFLAEAAFAQRDFLLDFVRVPVTPAIDRPSEVRGMILELAGVPAPGAAPAEGGVLSPGDGAGLLTIRTGTKRLQTAPREAAPSAGELAASPTIPAADEALARIRKQVIGEEKVPVRIAEKLARWAADARPEPGASAAVPGLSADPSSSLQRSRLYAALARGAGIPTRLVAGLASEEGKGFVYRVWAESYLEDWVAVDTLAGRVPADGTHARLATGDGQRDFAPLAGLLGRVTGRILEREN